MIYDAADTAIRYDAANTMKLAKNIYLSKGRVLYDDPTQPLMTLTEDGRPFVVVAPSTPARACLAAGECRNRVASAGGYH